MAICARFKGKEGHAWGNLMGKHTDFSVYAIITGNPNLELDEVGIPRSITMNLWYLERSVSLKTLHFTPKEELCH